MGIGRKVRRFVWTMSALLTTACGGPDLGGDLQPLRIHQFSLEPSCFVHPPIVQVPPNTSDAVITDAQARVNRDWDRAMVCAERYSAVVDAMNAKPSAEEWVVRPHEDKDVEVRVTSGESDRSATLGRFSIQINAPRAAPNERDECSWMRGPQDVALGQTINEFTMVTHEYFFARWNQNATAMTVPGPGGEFVVFLRGCDADTGLSFGRVVTYDSGSSIKCWDENGFTDCGGIDLFPFDFAEP